MDSDMGWHAMPCHAQSNLGYYSCSSKAKNGKCAIKCIQTPTHKTSPLTPPSKNRFRCAGGRPGRARVCCTLMGPCMGSAAAPIFDRDCGTTKSLFCLMDCWRVSGTSKNCRAMPSDSPDIFIYVRHSNIRSAGLRRTSSSSQAGPIHDQIYGD